MSKENKKVPEAVKILSKGLVSAAKESISDDVPELVRLTGMHSNTITSYLKGNVRDFNTGSVILTELRKLIKDRENFALELVA